MRPSIHFASTLLCLIPVLAAAQGPPTEAQCRGMTEGMLQSMKSAPLGEKDRQGARELIERVEKLVRDNRSRGTSECSTWAVVAKLIANQ